MRPTLRNQLAILALALLISVTAGFAGFCGKQQPKTVANVLTTLGNIKRDLRKSGELTPQQSADITRKLDAANRSYRQFVTDEQARVAAGKDDPNARSAALAELRSLLRGIADPSALGIKNVKSQQLWAESVATLNTILAALGG